MQPVLETPRLRLRLPSFDDVDGIAAYAGDPDVSRYVSWPRHRSPADAEAFLRYAIAAVEQQRECNWVIVERASERVAGTIGLRRQGHRVELGYALARVLEKLGMRREGRLAAWAVMPNLSATPRDCWCYARVK